MSCGVELQLLFGLSFEITENCLIEDGDNFGAEFVVKGQQISDWFWESDNPLSDGNWWQDLGLNVLGRDLSAFGNARQTDTSGFAAKRHHAIMTTCFTVHA